MKNTCPTWIKTTTTMSKKMWVLEIEGLPGVLFYFQNRITTICLYITAIDKLLALILPFAGRKNNYHEN